MTSIKQQIREVLDRCGVTLITAEKVSDQILTIIRESLPEEREYSWKDDKRGMYPSEQYRIEKATIDTHNSVITEIEKKLGEQVSKLRDDLVEIIRKLGYGHVTGICLDNDQVKDVTSAIAEYIEERFGKTIIVTTNIQDAVNWREIKLIPLKDAPKYCSCHHCEPYSNIDLKPEYDEEEVNNE